jgi:hypothetical protein
MSVGKCIIIFFTLLGVGLVSALILIPGIKDTTRETNVTEITYDNHEYLMFVNDRSIGSGRNSYSGVVHKVNCKYCNK